MTQASHDGGILPGPVLARVLDAPRRAHPGDVDGLLDRDRHSGQRARLLTAVDGRGFLQRRVSA
jgi:hypothetical protein